MQEKHQDAEQKTSSGDMIGFEQSHLHPTRRKTNKTTVSKIMALTGYADSEADAKHPEPRASNAAQSD
jgi:hypothetical protein